MSHQSYLVCTENLEQNQFSSGDWAVTWRTVKWELFLIQTAADGILQKPGGGKEKGNEIFLCPLETPVKSVLMYFCNLLGPLLICFIYNWPYTSELQEMALLRIHTYVRMRRHTPDCICTHKPCKLHTIDISGPWNCKTGKAGRTNSKSKKETLSFSHTMQPSLPLELSS